MVDYIFYDKCFMEHEDDIKGYNDFIFCGKFEYNSRVIYKWMHP